jgi:hypothetical protein
METTKNRTSQVTLYNGARGAKHTLDAAVADLTRALRLGTTESSLVRDILAPLMSKKCSEPTPRYLRPKAAAAYLGCSTSHLAHMRTEGVGPQFSQPEGRGKLLLYPVDALDRWAAAGRRSACRRAELSEDTTV